MYKFPPKILVWARWVRLKTHRYHRTIVFVTSVVWVITRVVGIADFWARRLSLW